jgi:hypothetical protein
MLKRIVGPQCAYQNIDVEEPTEDVINTIRSDGFADAGARLMLQMTQVHDVGGRFRAAFLDTSEIAPFERTFGRISNFAAGYRLRRMEIGHALHVWHWCRSNRVPFERLILAHRPVKLPSRNAARMRAYVTAIENVQRRPYLSLARLEDDRRIFDNTTFVYLDAP